VRIAVLIAVSALSLTAETLLDRLNERIRQTPGTVTLYARNLATGKSIGIREDEKVRTASTIKLPILVAVYQAVAEQKARWEETLLLREEDKVSGSGILREFSSGLRFPLRDLAHLMIVVSDNTATNLVLDRISTDYVNHMLDRLGLTNTRAMRKVLGSGRTDPTGHSKAGLREENKRFGLGSSTSREIVALLDKIEKRSILTSAACDEILALLKRQQDKGGIGRKLSAKYPVASKSGTLDLLRSDVGLVYSKSAPIAIAITIDQMSASDYTPDNAGSILIGDLAVLLVNGLGE